MEMGTIRVVKKEVKKNCPKCQTENVIYVFEADILWQINKNEKISKICEKCGASMDDFCKDFRRLK